MTRTETLTAVVLPVKTFASNTLRFIITVVFMASGILIAATVLSTYLPTSSTVMTLISISLLGLFTTVVLAAVALLFLPPPVTTSLHSTSSDIPNPEHGHKADEDDEDEDEVVSLYPVQTHKQFVSVAGLVATGITLIIAALPVQLLTLGMTVSTGVLFATTITNTIVYYDVYQWGVNDLNTRSHCSEELNPEKVRDRTAVGDPPGLDESREDKPKPDSGSTTNTGSGPGDVPSSFTRPSSHAYSSSPTNQHTRSRGNQSLGVPGGDYEYDWRVEASHSFDAVGGMDDIKQQLHAEVIHPLRKKNRAEELGVSAANIIFYGPPGTGKTYLAEALAGELAYPFAQLSAADIQSKWINESAQRVKQLFDEATELADQAGGAVIFIDELDSILKDRTAAGTGHEEDRKVVNEFLNYLEETDEHDIVFIGATNRRDVLDTAGTRSGRIDTEIHIDEPGPDARKAILKAQLADRTHDIPLRTLEHIAVNEMGGFVAADITVAVKTAAKNVLLRDGEGIREDDLATGITSVES